ncbi:replication-relaxation family protein [Kitasatospora sp. NPDC085930]|uniref:replication-relaxation family protein n=1 Tax=Kitasatospora sp. NPDC085930 TaxID=3364064 RepID=UPI0037C98FF2
MPASLFQFRIATAEQLRRLHTPDSGIEKMRSRLRRLREQGLAEELALPQSGRAKGWFLTEHGARIAAAFPELADIPAPRLLVTGRPSSSPCTTSSPSSGPTSRSSPTPARAVTPTGRST